MKQYLLRISLAFLLTIFLAVPASAEVSVELDRSGNYIRTIYIEKECGKKLKIWTKFGKKPRRYALNEEGDLNGDLRPTIKENVFHQNFPYVVWPKFDGYDYEIAISQWAEDRWTPIIYVEDTDNPFNDLDPRIDFDENGRPYLVWWRDEMNIGRVYISVFLKTRWMVAFPISEKEVDSRRPDITVKDIGTFEVTYATLEGLITKSVTIHFPDTITDDIDPFGSDLIEVSNNNDDAMEQ